MAKIDLGLPLLVVDDDAMVRGVVVEYLKSFGFTWVTEAKSPEQALKLINDPNFPLEMVITDWEMPKVSGLTILKAIRKNPARSNVRVVMITSQRSMERFKITQAAQWRVNAYLVKPFRADLLKAKIWDVLQWKKDESQSA